MEKVLIVIFTILFVVVSYIISAFPTMLLWNYLMPELTNGLVTKINIQQALALVVLCSILFKSQAVQTNH